MKRAKSKPQMSKEDKEYFNAIMEFADKRVSGTEEGWVSTEEAFRLYKMQFPIVGTISQLEEHFKRLMRLSYQQGKSDLAAKF